MNMKYLKANLLVVFSDKGRHTECEFLLLSKSWSESAYGVLGSDLTLFHTRSHPLYFFCPSERRHPKGAHDFFYSKA